MSYPNTLIKNGKKDGFHKTNPIFYRHNSCTTSHSLYTRQHPGCRIEAGSAYPWLGSCTFLPAQAAGRCLQLETGITPGSGHISGLFWQTFQVKGLDAISLASGWYHACAATGRDTSNAMGRIVMGSWEMERWKTPSHRWM
jgi:hypothetical protein